MDGYLPEISLLLRVVVFDSTREDNLVQQQRTFQKPTFTMELVEWEAIAQVLVNINKRDSKV